MIPLTVLPGARSPEHPRPPRLVSIVIPCRNGGPFIGDQLDAIERQRLTHPETGLEVVVVDNGSTDDTADVVRSRMAERPYLRLVDAPRATNISQVRNVGTRAACGDYLLWVDADDIVQDGWLEAMVEAAAVYDAVGGAVDEDTLNAGPWRHWRPPLHLEHDLPQPFGLSAPIGCNCGASREAFELVGGWDDSWACGGEEIDFFWRVQFAGLRLGYAEQAVVSYRFRRRVKDVWRQGIWYGVGNVALAAHHHRRLGIRNVAADFPSQLLGLLVLAIKSPVSIVARGKLGYYGGHLWGQVKGSIRYRHVRLG